MRILYFSRAYTTHDRRFLCRLAESPHEVWFLRLEDDGIVYEPRSVPAGIQSAEWLGGKRPVRSLNELLSLRQNLEAVIADVQPDLIHAGPVLSCGFLAAQTGFRPLLVMSWGSDILVEADRTAESRGITEYTLQNADMLLCDCHAVKAKAEQIDRYTAGRVIQFPWGIDLRQFAPGTGRSELREQTGWGNSFILLSCRTWAPGYGIDVLLEAFRLAHSQNSSLKLALLGDGPLADGIDRFLLHYGLQREVWRPGRVPQEQLPDYFRSANLYVSCVPSDGTSISLLEALATGLPVAVSDNDGNREWVRHGDNGWLARSSDAQAFAELFLHAATLEPAQREWIARNNRSLAEKRADWNVNSQLLLAAYERLASRPTGTLTAGRL